MTLEVVMLTFKRFYDLTILIDCAKNLYADSVYELNPKYNIFYIYTLSLCKFKLDTEFFSGCSFSLTNLIKIRKLVMKILGSRYLI